MKVAIKNISEIGTDCLSAYRAVGDCHECKRVEKCKLPEARAGRIKFYKIQIEKLKDGISKIEALIEEHTEKINIEEEMGGDNAKVDKDNRNAV